jgi:osmotically-inducible protein OsmY
MKIPGILIGTISLLLAGCATHYVTPSGEVITVPPGHNPADVALENSLRTQLDNYGQLGASTSNVQISSHDGTVTLKGTIPNEKDRQMVDALVRNTSGVVALNDDMQVAYPPTGFGPRVYPATPAYPTPAPIINGPAQ